jgi:NADH dehydrogenase FAD-containing subunit
LASFDAARVGAMTEREEAGNVAPTVVVVGGGYGGITVAKALDDIGDVVLVEPRETFVHNVAALRAVVSPEWAQRLFIPYDGLLTRGRVRRDRAVRVSASAVELASGEVLAADYVVLATGSTVPFPAKVDVADRAGAADRLRAVGAELARAERVLLLGAGPVGLEFAGEIRAAWPRTAVTIVDPADDLLSGRFPDDFRRELRAQLDALGVRLLLGTSLRKLPSSSPGRFGSFTVATQSGIDIAADIWFACYGAAAVSDYLDPELAGARQANGQLAVDAQLRVRGQRTVFAVGDVTAVPEMKMGRLAQKHAEVVAANIRALIEGRAEVVAYEPEPDAIVLPLGPTGGVSYAPDAGVLGAEVTAQIKATFFIEGYEQLLGATVPA